MRFITNVLSEFMAIIKNIINIFSKYEDKLFYLYVFYNYNSFRF